MLQHFYPLDPLYHPAYYHITVTWVINSCLIHCIHILSLPFYFPACIMSFYSEGQPLILSLMHFLRAFTPWWAVILLQWQHVSIRCNYIVKLPRGSLVDVKGLRIILVHLIVRRVGTADRLKEDWLFPHMMWAADLGHWAMSQ